MTLLMMPEDDDDESESVREGWLRDTGACVSQDYLSRLAAGLMLHSALRHQAGAGCDGLLFVT